MNIVFLFYDGMTALDAVGPHEILSRIPGANVKRVSLFSGSIRTDSDLVLNAEYSIAEVSEADILFLPGAGNATTLDEFPSILNWVADLHKKTKWTLSVCTGSLILGAAGLLRGVKATTHWAAMDRLAKWGALPVNERVVEDGRFITAAGVSAGIDMALFMIEKLLGSQAAQAFQLGIEYDPKPPFDSGSPEKADPKVVADLMLKMNSGFVD